MNGRLRDEGTRIKEVEEADLEIVAILAYLADAGRQIKRGLVWCGLLIGAGLAAGLSARTVADYVHWYLDLAN